MTVNLTPHIVSLLTQHNCVIVPEFGAFVAKHYAATFIKANLLAPPHKKVGFNASLQNSDGLLAHDISTKNHIPFAKAEKQISQWVTAAKARLKDGKQISLDMLGSVWLEGERIHFQPIEQGIGLPASFGLENIAITPLPPINILKPTPLQVAEEEKEPKTATPLIAQVEGTKKKRSWRWAAIIIPAALVSAALSTKSEVTVASFTHLWSSDAPSYQTRSQELNPADFSTNLDWETATINNNDQAYFSHEINGETVAIYNDKASKELSNLYHVIGGCFGELTNAEKAVSNFRNQGYDAHIVEKKFNLYRVSVASFETRRSALANAKQINRSEGWKSWVIKH